MCNGKQLENKMSDYISVVALKKWSNQYAFPMKVYYKAGCWDDIDETVRDLLLNNADTRPRNVGNERFLTLENVDMVFKKIRKLARSHREDDNDDLEEDVTTSGGGVKMKKRMLLKTIRTCLEQVHLVIENRRKRKIVSEIAKLLEIILHNLIINAIDMAVLRQKPHQFAVVINSV